MKVLFVDDALDQYDEWDDINKKIKKKIKALMKECQRTPYEGTGKPEPLKHDCRGIGRGISPMNTALCIKSRMKRCISSHARGSMMIDERT